VEESEAPAGGTKAKSALVVGDSLAVGAGPYLAGYLPGWRIEESAFTGRHTDDGVAEIAGRAGSLPPVLVVSLGTNDDPAATETFSGQVRRVLDAAGPSRCVVWPNIVRPPYNGVSYSGYNRELAAAALSAPNLILIDWSRMIAGHPEWLASDGVHATPAGYRARARAIAQAAAFCGQGNAF
jgi:lysophospholipase L1-like esterase